MHQVTNSIDVYIHIGPYKTGSSAIQSFLFRNKKVLNSLGYHYVCLDRDPNPVTNSRFILNEIRNKMSKLKTREAIEQTFNHQLKDIDLACKKLIISDESLCAYDIDFLNHIRMYFLNLGKKIRILFVPRRQDRIVISNYSQYIRNGGTQMDILSPRNLSKIIYYDQFSEKLLAIFERNELVFELYSENDNQISRRFLKLIDINADKIDWDDTSTHPNRSLSAGAISTLIHINNHLKQSGIFLSWIEKTTLFQALETKFPGRAISPTRDSVKKFLQNYAQSNEHFRKIFFPYLTELFPFNEDEYGLERHWVDVDHNEAINILRQTRGDLKI